MKPCQHKGEEIGYLGCSCQNPEPAYNCNLLDTPCAHKRPCKGNHVLTRLDNSKEWFTGHNPTCNTCQHYSVNTPDGSDTDL